MIVNVQNNLTWVDDTSSEAIGGACLWNGETGSSKRFAMIAPRGATPFNHFSLRVIEDNSQVYGFSTSIDKNKPVKVVYDSDTTSVQFYYWNGSSWIEMGSSQTIDLGNTIYAAITFEDNTSFTGADTIIVDDLYFSTGDYSTSTPSSGIIMQDNFTGTTIDTNKWNETDPDGKISQNNTLDLATDHSTTLPYFSDYLASVDTADIVISLDLSDVVTPVDSISFSLSRTFSEVATLVDSIDTKLILTEVFTETVTLVDSIKKTVSRTFTEAVTLVDTISKQLQRSFTEAVTLVDTVATKFVQFISLSEEVSLTDTLDKLISKNLSESITLVDTLTKLRKLVLTEATTLVDTIATKQSIFFSESLTLVDRIRNFLNGLAVSAWSKVTKTTATWSKDDKPDTIWDKEEKP